MERKVFIHDGDPLIYNCNVCKQFFSMEELLILRSKVDATIKFTESNDIRSLNEKLIDDHRDEMKRLHPEAAPWKKPLRVGFTYVMKDEALGFVKIGFSKDPLFRESTLQAEKPTITLVFSIDSHIHFEKFVQDNFILKRVRGEWFQITTYEAIDFINKNLNRRYDQK